MKIPLLSNEDATNRKDTTVLENPDDKIVPDEDLNAREEIKPNKVLAVASWNGR